MKGNTSLVKWWLLCGVVMIYFQIVIGGITRLTGSGLSITKWEIVTGTMPPLNESGWNAEFDKYKETPQYHKLNAGMSLSEFKFIYFWEFTHRLWARLMGIVFAIPFAIFLLQKKLSSALIKKLAVVIFLSGLAASFGWIMVKSGLVNRPWVDAYKLTLHLSLALVTYSYLLWLTLSQFFEDRHFTFHSELKRFSTGLILILSFQLILGGLMSGMKAGLLYPTFPDMNGRFIPEALSSSENWSLSAFLHYDRDPFAGSLVHFTHRLTAYLLALLALIFFYRARKTHLTRPLSIATSLMIFILAAQILLGILTVINFKGGIPVALGVLHQGVGILLLTSAIAVHFLLRKNAIFSLTEW